MNEFIEKLEWSKLVSEKEENNREKGRTEKDIEQIKNYIFSWNSNNKRPINTEQSSDRKIKIIIDNLSNRSRYSIWLELFNNFEGKNDSFLLEIIPILKEKDLIKFYNEEKENLENATDSLLTEEVKKSVYYKLNDLLFLSDESYDLYLELKDFMLWLKWVNKKVINSNYLKKKKSQEK